MPNSKPTHSPNGLHYEIRGHGKETILFSHGMAWNTELYKEQMTAFSSRFRCVAYDHIGQGQSVVPSEGDEISIETCTDKTIALIKHLDLAPCHFVGLSMGGFVGMRIAARRPDLLKSLTLMATSPDPETPDSARSLRFLSFMVRYLGAGLIKGGAAKQLLGETTLKDPAKAEILKEAIRIIGSNKRSLFKTINGVLRRDSCRHELAKIDLPTAIIHGEEDAVFPLETAKELTSLIRNARMVSIPGAGHSLPFENPKMVNEALEEFLSSDAVNNTQQLTHRINIRVDKMKEST